MRHQQKSIWFKDIFDAYDKMHHSGTFSRPFLCTELPEDTTIINPQLSFSVKLTDIDHMFDLKDRLCVDGSSMVECNIHYELSYVPISDITSIRVMIDITATIHNMTLYIVDITNAFQRNIITDIQKHHYIRLRHSMLNGTTKNGLNIQSILQIPNPMSCKLSSLFKALRMQVDIGSNCWILSSNKLYT